VDITGQRRQIFVAKANGHLVAYGRALQLALLPVLAYHHLDPLST
jgi:hypothetical protein